MKPPMRARSPLTMVAGILLVTAAGGFSSEFDRPPGRPVHGFRDWPAGLNTLINTTPRIWGYNENSTDTFFYSGGASNLAAFLLDYSKLQGIEHRLVLHAGTGEAKSIWANPAPRFAFDWKLYVERKSWHNIGPLSSTNSIEAFRQAAQEPGFIVEVHFWTDGTICLEELDIPRIILLQNEQ